MKRNVQLFVIFCLAVSLISFCSACAKKQVEVVPVADTSADDAAKAAAAKAAADKAAADKALADKAAAEAKARADAEAAAAKARADAEAVQKLNQDQIIAFESEKIYFDYDKADLKPEAQATLEKKAKFLDGNTSYLVTIEGNCDERGTNEYNLALGERRADAAKNFLSSLGVSADRITTVSYGEEKPVVVGNDESAWSQNRRDEFKLSK
jgi:peptidoglycan-associated lipoprotein